MKRYLLCMIALPLFCCACTNKVKDTDINTVTGAVWEALDTREEYTEADADFIKTNLMLENEIEEGRIYLGDGKEIGIFKLQNGVEAEIAEQAMKEYLTNEANSFSTLLDLYPDEGLEEKLAHYKGATIAHKGRYVCYFVLPKDEAEKAKSALYGALS